MSNNAPDLVVCVVFFLAYVRRGCMPAARGKEFGSEGRNLNSDTWNLDFSEGCA